MPPKRKTASPKVGSTVRKTTDFPPPPMWPPLEPLVPTQDLALENLLDNQIVLIRKLFTSTLCRKYVSFFESLPLMTTPAKPKAGEAVRVNDRIQYDDYVFAQQLWEKTSLQSLLSESAEPGEPDSVSSKDAGRRWGGDLCGLNPRVRIYKYSENQFFAPHCKYIYQIPFASRIDLWNRDHFISWCFVDLTAGFLLLYVCFKHRKDPCM